MPRPTFCRLTVAGDEVRLRSTYDVDFIAALKQIPAHHRRWSADEGVWYFAARHLPYLERLARGFTIAEVVDGRQIRNVHTGVVHTQAEQLPLF